MSNENIDGMKKLIEEKKRQSSQQSTYDKQNHQRNENLKGGSRKAFKTTKTGGVFDK